VSSRCKQTKPSRLVWVAADLPRGCSWRRFVRGPVGLARAKPAADIVPLALQRFAARPVTVSVWLDKGMPNTKVLAGNRLADRDAIPASTFTEDAIPMLIVGIDPHKSSHTAAALDTATGTAVDQVTVAATAKDYRHLTAWLAPLGPAKIAIENARGLGRHLADHLACQGYTVVDVTTKEVRAQRLSRRSGRNKNDPLDALAAAYTAATGSGYAYTGTDNSGIAEVLSEEREALNAEATAKRNRLHALMRLLRPGGAPVGATEADFANLLKGVKVADPVAAETKRWARDLLADLRRLARALEANRQRMSDLTEHAATGLTAIPGIAAIGAVAILAAAGDPGRFATHHHLAAFAGAAPKQVASGNSDRHRLDRRGHPQLKRALHTAAMTQARMKTGPGHVYYQRKRDEGKTHREALRCLKRQLVKVIWRTLNDDAHRSESAALKT
jgi:transposase